MKPDITISKVLCALTVLAGGGWAIAQCVIDVRESTKGVAFGTDEYWAQMMISAAPTLAVLICAAWVGSLFSARRWFKASALSAIVIVAAAITASNGIDFMTNATVAKNIQEQRRATKADDIAQIKVETAKVERKETIENLWRTYTVTKKIEDKEKVLAQIKSITDAPIAIDVAEVTVAKTGSGGLLHRWFGWRPEAVQEAKAVAIPILVALCKSLFITLGFAFWPSKQRAKDRPPDGDGDTIKKDPTNTVITGVFDGSKVSQFQKASREVARADLARMLREGHSVPSVTALKDRWNWKLIDTLRFVKKLESEGLLRTKKEGRNRVILRPQPKIVASNTA